MEDYSYIKGALTESERQTLAKLREAMLFVLETHGLGYGKSVCQTLFESELKYREIGLEKGKIIEVVYDNELIRSFPMRFWLIENQMLCDVTALQERILPEHIVRTQTFLKKLKLSAALIVNFGKSQLELRGVRC